MGTPNMILYAPDETNFEHNGEYVLDSVVYGASVDWTLLDAWELSFSLPTQTPFNIEIKNGHFIKAPTPAFDAPQLFYVYRTERDLHEWRVYALHVYTKLKFTYILDSFIQNRNPAEAVEQLVNFGEADLLKKFKAITNTPTNINNSRIVRMNALRAITDEALGNSVVTRYESEFIADNFELQLLRQVGEDRGVDIRFGRDLLSFAESVDYSDMVGRIVPQGFNGYLIKEEDGGRFVSLDDIEEIEETFTGNEHTYRTVNVTYSDVKAAVGANEFDEDAIPEEEAVALLKQFAREEFTRNKVHEPHTSYDVDFITQADYASNEEEKELLGKLQKIKPGDVIEVIDDRGKSIIERVIGYSYDPIRRVYTGLTLANRSPELTLQSEAEQALGQTTNNLEAITERVEELEITSSGHHSRLRALETAEYDGFRYGTSNKGKDNTLAGGTNNVANVNASNSLIAGGADNYIDGANSYDLESGAIIGGTNNLIKDNARNVTILNGVNVAVGSPLNSFADHTTVIGKNIKIEQMDWAGSLVHGINTFDDIQGMSVRFYRQYRSEPEETIDILRANRHIPEHGFTTVSGKIMGMTPDRSKLAVYQVDLYFDGSTALLDGSIVLKAHKGDIDGWNVKIGGIAGVILNPLQAEGGLDEVLWQARFDIDTFTEYP